MTPLAQQLLNDWCLPVRERAVQDPYNVLREMISAKCFECSALKEFVVGVANSDATTGDLLDSDRIFAPAPVTFLEMNWEGRYGYLFVESGNDTKVYLALINPRAAIVYVGSISSGDIVLNRDKPSYSAEMWHAIALLFLVNTPNLLGNITRLPHAGLQKKIAHAQGMTGKFPLLAWTEITLWLRRDGSDAEAENREIEARLSARKCLHFVRAFLRWRLGKMELVRSHWKGDGSLGIKRSRYKMAA